VFILQAELQRGALQRVAEREDFAGFAQRQPYHLPDAWFVQGFKDVAALHGDHVGELVPAARKQGRQAGKRPIGVDDVAIRGVPAHCFGVGYKKGNQRQSAFQTALPGGRNARGVLLQLLFVFRQVAHTEYFQPFHQLMFLRAGVVHCDHAHLVSFCLDGFGGLIDKRHAKVALPARKVSGRDENFHA